MTDIRSAFAKLLFCIGALAASVPAVTLAAPAPPQAAPVRTQILFLYDEDTDAFPGLARIDRSLRESFQSELGKSVDLHSESLDISQFRRAGYERMLADFYRRKYADKQPDLIVAVLEPSLDFLLRHGETAFPGVPIVFSGIESSTLKGKSLRANFTGILLRREFSPTVEIALRLQPDTRNLFVVGGSSPFDRHLLALARRDLKPYEGRVAIRYLVDLPMDALLQAVSTLPADSVVVFTTLFSDGAGQAFVPHEALSSIAKAANAPVYVALDQYVGTGSVGGNVYSVDTLGAQAAALGLQILRGARPVSLAIREVDAQIDLFDARQLKRWGLDEARLPSGSVIRYREPSTWQQYRWYVLGTIAVILLQSALITGMIVARVRRRQAEEDSRRQRSELAHVLRVTTMGELTAALAHDINQPLTAITMNAQAAHRLMDRGAAQAPEVRDALTDIAADAMRAGEIIQRLRMLFRKEQVEPLAVDINALLQGVVRLLQSAIMTRRIDVRLALEHPLSPVLADPVQLEQVLLNVLVNACDAIGAVEDGPRTITLRSSQPQPGRLALEIADTGIGVKDAELERIFEHFVSTKPQGLGMGLAISRSIINAHGGRIWATGNSPRGLVVHIELPAAGSRRA